MGEPRVLPSELVRALEIMIGEETTAAEEAFMSDDHDAEFCRLAKAAVLREAVAVIKRASLPPRTVRMEDPSAWAGTRTCSRCNQSWPIGSHIIGSTAHVCPARHHGQGATDGD